VGVQMRLSFAALAVLVSSAAYAMDEKTTYGMNNLQTEMTVCAVYYSQVKACVGGESKVFADSTQATVDHLSTFLVKIGRSIGMSRDAIMSRMQMVQDEQSKLIQGNCINMASLYKRHAERCKIVVENGDSILKEYMDK
jgi:hypothetical protein